MKHIVIIPNKTKDKDYAVSKRVAEKLSSLGAELYIESKYETDLGGFACVKEAIPDNTELILVIGGDGSVIDASVPAVKLGVPVVGVNLGNLGYLAEVEPDSISVFEKLFSGEYRIEEKMLLSVGIGENGEIKRSERLAVNDVIISHQTYVGLAELSLTDTHGSAVKYRADGLILSTPVGSTAYSLSAGGPIISHDIDCIMATPICPHSFFDRSVIFRPNECLTLTNKGQDSLNITVDGRFFAKLAPGESCYVRCADKTFKMLSFSENYMFSTLFGKMKRFENI